MLVCAVWQNLTNFWEVLTASNITSVTPINFYQTTQYNIAEDNRICYLFSYALTRITKDGEGKVGAVR
jgi:hypothetical protein